MPDKKTGWERENRTHFDEVVETYDKVRPTYPDEIFADIFEYAGNGKKTLEIGAGTGKATAPFLDAGYDVTAVELGANMSEFLQERFKGNEKFRVITATFEEAPLTDNTYNLIYAASAFHWVDAEIGCPKVFRLIKSGGTIALFRYNAIPGIGAMYEEIQAVYTEHFYSYYTSGTWQSHRKTLEDYNTPAEIHSSFRCERLENYGFNDVFMKLCYGEQTFSDDEYLSVLDTMSDHRALPESNRIALYAGIKDAINRHGGFYTRGYDFQLYMGRKV